jgi:hypothetical protein
MESVLRRDSLLPSSWAILSAFCVPNFCFFMNLSVGQISRMCTVTEFTMLYPFFSYLKLHIDTFKTIDLFITLYMCEIYFLTMNVNLRVGGIREQKITIIFSRHTVEIWKEMRQRSMKFSEFVLTANLAFLSQEPLKYRNTWYAFGKQKMHIKFLLRYFKTIDRHGRHSSCLVYGKIATINLMFCWPCIIVYQYSETNVMPSHITRNVQNTSIYKNYCIFWNILFNILPTPFNIMKFYWQIIYILIGYLMLSLRY